MSAVWTTPGLTADLLVKLRRDLFVAVAECMVCPRSQQRVDVLAMHRKLEDRPFLIFEIKTSRADLLHDLKREKWRGYLPHGALAFAFPAGLALPAEIPTEAGVIVRGDAGWTWKRGPRWARAPRPSAYLYRRMILSASDDALARGRAQIEPRPADLHRVARTARTEVARRIARAIGDADLWAGIVDDHRRKWAELDAETRGLRQELINLRSERRLLAA